MASVEVQQLQSKHVRVFMNVHEEYGSIDVCGSCHKTPTYLLQDGIMYTLISFDDMEHVQEWLDKHSKKYFKITEITSTERIRE